MLAAFGPCDWGVVAAYFAAMIYIGVVAARKNQGTEEYFLAGRSIPSWALAISIVATTLSAATFVGVPDLSYNGNLTYLTPQPRRLPRRADRRHAVRPQALRGRHRHHLRLPRPPIRRGGADRRQRHVPAGPDAGVGRAAVHRGHPPVPAAVRRRAAPATTEAYRAAALATRRRPICVIGLRRHLLHHARRHPHRHLDRRHPVLHRGRRGLLSIVLLLRAIPLPLSGIIKALAAPSTGLDGHSKLQLVNLGPRPQRPVHALGGGPRQHLAEYRRARRGPGLRPAVPRLQVAGQGGDVAALFAVPLAGHGGRLHGSSACCCTSSTAGRT